ncbi:MAG TPA: FAD-binding and (Fe-S)-binding domain-containing protein [Solirubrobacterales bacterium]
MKPALSAAEVERIAPPPVAAAPDRAPEELAAGTPAPLRRDLEGLLGADRVLSRAIDIVRYASDASPYRRFPQVVVAPRDAGEVARVLDYARRSGIPVTLRAAGTSLNGQGQGDGIMVDVRRHWAGVEIEDGGETVRVRPGTTLGHVNRLLMPVGRKLGPDPASTDFATVGGVVANNSGGMRCGTTKDSYSTLRSLSFVLPSGTAIDSAAPGAAERFAAAEPALAAGLAEIRDEIRADEELSARIRSKFEIKNTMGYRLCAFLDADEPVEIFRRLLVGSEGTLGFVSEAVFETVPLGRYTTTALLLFEDMESAADVVQPLVAAGTTATEVMVAPTLITAAWNLPGTPEEWKEIPPTAAAILCEFRSDDEADLDGHERDALALIEGRPLVGPAEFTRDVELTEMFWRVREGMHGLIGRLRPEGTSLIVEDVCVRPERIAEAARDIQALLGKHEFLPGVAGHASAGNLHFMLTPAFGEERDRERYEAFMGELVELILDEYDGSLKAEHGTGINMAPFVEREWGAKATELMWRVKGLADPDGVLGPGIVLNRDPGVHLRDLKSTPPIEETGGATLCVECGFCEPVCPSRDLTTTPRQRLVVRREMARQPAGSALRAALAEQYVYDGIETCAVDGSCKLACPLAIDTGALVKELREREAGDRAERAGLAAARRWGAVERLARGGLRAAHAVERVAGEAPLRGSTGIARRALGEEVVPAWERPMPPAADARLPETSREGAAAVYFPACINRIFGSAGANGGEPASLPAALVEISRRAGLPVWIPPDAAGRCCAVPWSSKGLAAGHARMAAATAAAIWRWTGGGELPLVVDASSCTHGIAEEIGAALDDDARERHAAVEVIDSVTWALERLAPKLDVRRKVASAAIHPTCSGRHLGTDTDLVSLAWELADDVTVPAAAACCGFAGDRGFLHPELTEAATAPEATELAGREFDAYLSSNRTCEVGLERATGKPYRSPILLMEELTR